MNSDDDNIPSLNLRELKVLSALGRGAKGVVFLVQNGSSNGELLALKSILRSSITKKGKGTNNKGFEGSDGDDYRRICFEKEVLRQCQHPLLPKLRGVLSTDSIVGYAIDYCPGRDLNYLRRKQTERMFSDDIIRFYAAELVLALEYLHGLGIVYRDLKPENVMIQEDGHLMLVDFDLSTKLTPKQARSTRTVMPKDEPPMKKKKKKRFAPFYKCCNPGISPAESVHPAESVDYSVSGKEPESNSKSNSFVGTEEYVAPEMIQGKGHDFAVDWWCLGVVLHEMLYGETPFKGINRKETFYRILSKTPELVGEPTALRDLIRRLLEKDPEERIRVAEIKGHDFFKGVDWEKVVEISRPPFIPGRFDIDEEEVDGSKRIDIESFVQGVFKVDGDVTGDAKVTEKDETAQNQDFLIF